MRFQYRFFFAVTNGASKEHRDRNACDPRTFSLGAEAARCGEGGTSGQGTTRREVSENDVIPVSGSPNSIPVVFSLSTSGCRTDLENRSRLADYGQLRAKSEFSVINH